MTNLRFLVYHFGFELEDFALIEPKIPEDDESQVSLKPKRWEVNKELVVFIPSISFYFFFVNASEIQLKIKEPSVNISKITVKLPKIKTTGQLLLFAETNRK